MFVPAPATMRVGDVMEVFDHSSDALFVEADSLARGDAAAVMDVGDVSSAVGSGALGFSEILVRVK